jgi:tetratricopeptide (TPR) repeat protein
MRYNLIKKISCVCIALACTSLLSTPSAHAGGVVFGGFLDKRTEVLKTRFEADPKNQKFKTDYINHLKRIGASARQFEHIKSRLLEDDILKNSAALKFNKILPTAPQSIRQKTATANKTEAAFRKAKYLEKKGEWEKAERNYQKILKESPQASRVKLDLATLYAKRGYDKDSKELFSEVLKSSPPPAVKQNVTLAIKQMDARLKRNEFSGVVLLGVNSDTNGNSVSSSGNVIVNDVQVPLTSASLSEADFQAIALAVVNHRYNFDYERNDTFKTKWFSSASAYTSQQAELNELDIGLISVKTGPNLTTQSGTEMGYNVGYAVVNLDGESYLDTVSNELYLNHPFTSKLTVKNVGLYEHRHFTNSPTNTTITGRTGEAYQIQQTGVYKLSPTDLVSAGYSLRREVAREEVFDNEQLSFSLSYLHAFKNGVLATLKSGYKVTEYEIEDPFVSATTIRKDKEGTGGFSVSKKLFNEVTGVVGYEYKDVDSSLENFQYKNHRISTSFSYGF